MKDKPINTIRSLLLGSSFILSSFITLPALATPEEELAQTQKAMEAAKERQVAIQEEEDKLADELKNLQDRLVKTAQATQKAEFDVSDAEDKLRILTEEVRVKSEALKTQKQHLSNLIMAELSLSNTPPEAMLMMPEDPLDIMKAARALSMASESIRLETQSLAAQLAELNALKAQVTEHRDQLAVIQATLDKEHQELIGQLADRTALQKKLSKEQKQQEETLSKLAQKSSDLKDLITGIEKEETKRSESEAKKNKPSRETDAKHLRSFEEAQGHIRTPASGKLMQKFGVSEGRNATSKGITIATRSGASVTAPYDGEVVFTGPFLNYGQMIIIRHSDDFHTLLAGLATIDVRVGQFLLEGEPIGAMGEGKNEHTLYIELRKDNQPVDPAEWISGLNKMSR